MFPDKNFKMNEIMILLCVGLAAGFLSGLVGIGGGIIIVPALVYFLTFSQQQAQGTALFILLLPTGILAVLNYYKAGFVDWRAGLLISLTFVLGGYFGSKTAITLDQTMVKRIFGAFMILIGAKILFWK